MKLYQNKMWLEEQLKNVKNKEAIARMCNCSGDTINYWMKKLSIPNIDYSTVTSASRIHTVNEQYFDIIDTEEKAYWLGYIMADGCISTSSSKLTIPNEFTINCKGEDSDHLHKLNLALSSDYPIKVTEKFDRRCNSSYEIAELKIRSVKLCSSFIKNQVIPRKTGKEIIPNTINNSHMLHFIRGFFDGDGSIFKRPSCYGVHVGKCSRQIIVQIQDFFKSNSISWKMYVDYHYNMPFYYLDTNKKDTVIAILHLLYDNATIYLNRKFRKAQEVIHNISSLMK